MMQDRSLGDGPHHRMIAKRLSISSISFLKVSVWLGQVGPRWGAEGSRAALNLIKHVLPQALQKA